MITEEMLAIYARFHGDMDGFARAGSARDRALMSQAQWYVLDAFLLELHAVKARLASPVYAEQIESRLSAMSANPRVRKWLWQLA